jgi:hypothetical protein
MCKFCALTSSNNTANNLPFPAKGSLMFIVKVLKQCKLLSKYVGQEGELLSCPAR